MNLREATEGRSANRNSVYLSKLVLIFSLVHPNLFQLFLYLNPSTGAVTLPSIHFFGVDKSHVLTGEGMKLLFNQATFV